jgi:hypothetical protein
MLSSGTDKLNLFLPGFHSSDRQLYRNPISRNSKNKSKGNPLMVGFLFSFPIYNGHQVVVWINRFADVMALKMKKGFILDKNGLLN